MKEEDLTNVESWEKTAEKSVCPKCEKECIKELKEEISDHFENEGSCLECLSGEEIADFHGILKVKLVRRLAKAMKDD